MNDENRESESIIHEFEDNDYETPFIAYDRSASIRESRIELIPARQALKNMLGHFEKIKRKRECQKVNIERLENDIVINNFKNEDDLQRNQSKLLRMKKDYDIKNQEWTKLLDELKVGVDKIFGVSLDSDIDDSSSQVDQELSENQKIEEMTEMIAKNLKESLEHLGHLKKTNEEYQRLMNRKNEEKIESSSSEMFTVSLIGKENGFGFSITGGANWKFPLYVSKIVAGGAAEEDGRLMEGDEIVEFNGKNVEGASHADVVVLFAANRKNVKLLVRRRSRQWNQVSFSLTFRKNYTSSL